MKPLDRALRNQLEKIVREARDVAEAAAKIALEQLGVGEANPYPHLTEEECDLRRKLRVHGRQLGDSLNGEKIQSIDRLIEEIAYEHWHRMLFARFLAENNLLMYPDPANPVPVTLEECKDLAAKEGAKNGWELAARFAAHMLPQIFRPNSPVFQLSLPPEYEQKLEKLIDELPAEVFTASDSIGWVYQFWQEKRKDEINSLGLKIGARELPAVTQLFTEPYMVGFLLDNTLGAWWAFHKLTRNDLAALEQEVELRQKASLPNVPLKYLRFSKEADGTWLPIGGSFDDWPDQLKNLKVLDPCCGSGHFLVAAFLMLVAMRIEREHLSIPDAVDAVLKENLYGLEIDQRCVELAAFALAFAAWRYPGAGGYRHLPQLNLACTGLKIGAKKEDWLSLAGDNANLRYTLEILYRQFDLAPLFGSLTNPGIGLGRGTIVEMTWKEVGPLLSHALDDSQDDEKTEMGITAYGLAKAAAILKDTFHLIATNVPFRQSGDLADEISDFAKTYYPLAKTDIATIFFQRLLELLSSNGRVSIVVPQGFLYKNFYAKFREELFRKREIPAIVRLGPAAFRAISGEEVKVCLVLACSKKPDANSVLTQIDLTNGNADYKEESLPIAELIQAAQNKVLVSSKNIVSIKRSSQNELLEDFAIFSNGIQTSDYPRFGRCFWELEEISDGWAFQLSTVTKTDPFSGREHCLYWQEGKGELIEFIKSIMGEKNVGISVRGLSCKGKKGVAISAMGALKATLYNGELFDDNTIVLLPNERTTVDELWQFCSSPNYNKLVREVDQSNKVRAALLRVPYVINNANGSSIFEKISSIDPTQWLFHGNPAQSHYPLQVAVIRLLGYQWPAEKDSKIELSEEARKLLKKSQELVNCADDDGIVCIPSVRGESKAEDRLENLLAAAYGTQWSPARKAELLAASDHAGKTLESWLRDRFFAQHCKLFHDRPFIWHIWDGLNDGFAVLVDYHKLDRKLLEALTYTYLGDWINQQKQENARRNTGAEEKLAAAERLKKRLELILQGEKPYDIFVRWKPIEQQPIGWNPDTNDGVRLNIRPFVSVPDVGKKGAGVLRDKPNINWGKDRGKDVESAPWFKLGPLYGGNEGDRINDHHLSLAEKRAAREKNASK